MRIAVYYLIDGHLRHQVVESGTLSAEMNGIAAAFQDSKSFRWVPERALQEKLIADAAKEVYIDPIREWEPFRRAVIQDQESHWGERS